MTDMTAIVDNISATVIQWAIDYHDGSPDSVWELTDGYGLTEPEREELMDTIRTKIEALTPLATIDVTPTIEERIAVLEQQSIDTMSRITDILGLLRRQTELAYTIADARYRVANSPEAQRLYPNEKGN